MNDSSKKKHNANPAERMSDDLKGEEGQEVLKELQEYGLLDENFCPLELSNSESAVLAYQIAITLDIKDVWKVFSTLWEVSPNALRAAYNREMDQKKTRKFLEKLPPSLKDGTSTRT